MLISAQIAYRVSCETLENLHNLFLSVKKLITVFFWIAIHKKNHLMLYFHFNDFLSYENASQKFTSSKIFTSKDFETGDGFAELASHMIHVSSVGLSVFDEFLETRHSLSCLVT